MTNQSAITAAAFTTIGADRPSRWVITCDHATNKVPADINGGDLGLPAEDMMRHIAYDVGADGVSTHLADLLDAPYVRSEFSRLVIDPNRGDNDPTLVMKLYDGSIIPANRHVDAAEVQRRRETLHKPYHDAVSDVIARREQPLICAIHSFTPQLKGGDMRPWHVGVLFAEDERLARPFLDLIYQEDDICTGENEPYGGHLPGDALDRHAMQPGHPNILIEVRNDLIETETQQKAWATRLAPILQQALINSGL
ncbi:N-formylglutamate amidohydrolase [Thalassobius sp. I31.1]|uniref:N-formylglutamate amidohydrolase n=1 Tax=Thalassobius sp. I31.1 TaxID=2109912 RepID=UPI000D1BF5D7|nr:N-formylglutamate amidohydrolase [Thalassobius sp. I31.1]